MWLKRFCICLPFFVLIAVSYGAAQAGRGGRGGNDPWPGKKKLLAIADVQTGFHHDSISHALATIDQLGRESGT